MLGDGESDYGDCASGGQCAGPVKVFSDVPLTSVAVTSTMSWAISRDGYVYQWGAHLTFGSTPAPMPFRAPGGAP